MELSALAAAYAFKVRSTAASPTACVWTRHPLRLATRTMRT